MRAETKSPGASCPRRGAALLAAVAFLAIFSMLGVSYLGYMTVEEERVLWRARTLRAETLASDFLHTALHEVHARLAAGEPIPAELLFGPVPIYRGGLTGMDSLREAESLRGEVRVRIEDEAAKLDINRAAPWLVTAVTGLDEDAARAVRAQLGVPFAQRTRPDLPLRHLKELHTRGFLDEATVDALPADRVTVFSAPGPLLNANALSPAMLAAVLGLDEEAAERVAASRPFATREALEAAVGEGVSVTAALGIASRCYRFRVEAALLRAGPNDEWARVRTHRIEAVALFSGPRPEVVFWESVDSLEDDEVT